MKNFSDRKELFCHELFKMTVIGGLFFLFRLYSSQGFLYFLNKRGKCLLSSESFKVSNGINKYELNSAMKRIRETTLPDCANQDQSSENNGENSEKE